MGFFWRGCQRIVLVAVRWGSGWEVIIVFFVVEMIDVLFAARGLCDGCCDV